MEEATEAVASVDILDEAGVGRDAGRGTADDVADDVVVASVNLGGKAEKASEDVLIITKKQGKRGTPSLLKRSSSCRPRAACPSGSNDALFRLGQVRCRGYRHGVKVCPGPIPRLPVGSHWDFKQQFPLALSLANSDDVDTFALVSWPRPN